MSARPREPRVPGPARTAGPDGVRLWAWVGLVAQIGSVIGWLVAAVWQRPGYSPVRDSISDMIAFGAPYAAFLVVVLALYGAAMIVFALVSVRTVLRPGGWRATAGSVALALSIFGLAELLAPLEREACQTSAPGCTPDAQLADVGGQLDEGVSILGIVAFAASGFLIAAAMRRTPGWHRWARPTRWVTAAVTVVFVVDIVSFSVSAGTVGLYERLAFALAAAGIAALAVGVLRPAA